MPSNVSTKHAGCGDAIDAHSTTHTQTTNDSGDNKNNSVVTEDAALNNNHNHHHHHHDHHHSQSPNSLSSPSSPYSKDASEKWTDFFGRNNHTPSIEFDKVTTLINLITLITLITLVTLCKRCVLGIAMVYLHCMTSLSLSLKGSLLPSQGPLGQVRALLCCFSNGCSPRLQVTLITLLTLITLITLIALIALIAMLKSNFYIIYIYIYSL